MYSYSFSAKERNFKVFTLRENGNYSTWIGSFTSKNMWIQNSVEDFNAKQMDMKAEIVFDSPTVVSITFYNPDGIQTGESKAIKKS